MTAVTVVRRSANITVKSVNGVLAPADANRVTLNNQGAVVGSGTRLDTMQDVVEGSPQDGYTLIYNSSDDKYYVQALSLDGGNF
jgi:hypothetical protein